MTECDTCGSSNFFTLSDGHSYCSICQTRVDAVEETDEYGLVGTLVRKTQSQKSSQFSENWTTFEAYNVILAKQTDIISDLCNLGDDFKKLVFTIWSLYLDKIEVAFENNVEPNKKPKINHKVNRRNFNCLIKEEKQMNFFTKRKPEKYLANVCVGNKIVRIIKKDNLFNSDSMSCDDSQKTWDEYQSTYEESQSTHEESQSANEESIFSELSQPESSNQDYDVKYKPKNSVLHNNKVYLESYTNLNSEKLANMGIDDNVLAEIEEEEINLSLAQTDEEKKLIEKKLYALKQSISLSKITKSLKDNKLLDDEKKNRANYYERLDINNMSINKTITIIYIALRLLNVDIYAFDLLRWINQGIIPFYFTLNLIPQNWLLTMGDWLTFYKAKSMKDLNKTCSTMANFLSIKKLPLPNVKKLIIRIIDDLNLPFSIAKLIINLFEKNLEKKDGINSLFFKQNKGWYLFPDYEMYIMGIIILVIRKIFSINDYHEIYLSKKLKKSDDFILTEWEEHIYFKMNCFQKYIYLNSYFHKNFENIDMLINHLNIEKKNEKPDFLTKDSNKNTKEFNKKNNLGKVFNKFLNKNENYELKPSLYPFKTMTELIIKNFKTNNDELLKKDFRSKKINYLFENNCENMFFKEDKFSLSNDIDEKFKFLLNLGNFYLQTLESKFFNRVRYVENNFFKNYYESANMENKRQKQFKKFESFIEDFVFETCYSNNEDDEQNFIGLKTMLI